MKYSPINLDYFLEMEVASGGPSKQILNLNGKLKKVKDIVEYWKANPTPPELTPETWQYYNCMLAGFRHNVANHHELGWDELTQEYYNSLKLMSDDEIESYLQNNPVEFDNGFIKHSYHRAYAMIGRLIRGERYIPFYMKESQIYNEPRPEDGIMRTTSLTSKIKLLSQIDSMGIDRNEYCLCQSAILTVMGIRVNDDLDIIISSKLRSQSIQFPSGVEVFAKDRGKFDYFGASGDDDILENYCISIDGYKFLEPRFYFARKHIGKTKRDISDWDGIHQFYQRGGHLGYPFAFEFYKWGLPAMATQVQLTDIDLSTLEIVKDKYDRVVNGVNQGRVVYKGNGYYVKIFHPDYCRLGNFHRALSSGFLNGLVPSLTHLIMSNDKVVGYVTLSGEHPTTVPQPLTRTILRNSKQRSMVFYDLVPINVIKDSYYGQWGLIDLESVYAMDSLSDMKTHNAEMKPSNLLEMINNI
jgi:hypothetical protein